MVQRPPLEAGDWCSRFALILGDPPLSLSSAGPPRTHAKPLLILSWDLNLGEQKKSVGGDTPACLLLSSQKGF